MQIRQIFKKANRPGDTTHSLFKPGPLLSFHHPFPPLLLLLLSLLFGFTMSDYDLLSATGIPSPSQSVLNVVSPGIVSLFIQGLETGLVVSQFAQWLSLDRKEGITITVLVLFVTTVGFVETAICFSSAWRIYVHHFGQAIVGGWTERVHAMLSTLVAAPIQAYFIYRCYHIVKNSYLIIPLVATLVSTVVTAGWITAWLFRTNSPARIAVNGPPNQMVYYPFVVFLTLPAILDITITSILLRSLIKFLRRIHAEHLRRRLIRYIVVTWQAVIPPSFCAVALLILYLTFTHAHPGKPQMWYPAIQAMLGKLYVLSLFFTLNNRMDLAAEPPMTYVTTMGAAPLDSMSSPTRRFILTLPFTEQSVEGC